MVLLSLIIKFGPCINKKVEQKIEQQRNRITHTITLYSDNGGVIKTWEGRLLYNKQVAAISFISGGKEYCVTGTITVEEK